MNVAIVYYSRHHENTKQVLDHLAAGHEIRLIDITEEKRPELASCEIIGFASGIYYGKFHESLIRCAREQLPEGRKVFFLYTCGSLRQGYTKAIQEAALSHGATILGAFGCYGLDTYGPFKLLGGLRKGHPDVSELEQACEFYESILSAE